MSRIGLVVVLLGALPAASCALVSPSEPAPAGQATPVPATVTEEPSIEEEAEEAEALAAADGEAGAAQEPAADDAAELLSSVRGTLAFEAEALWRLALLQEELYRDDGEDAELRARQVGGEYYLEYLPRALVDFAGWLRGEVRPRRFEEPPAAAAAYHGAVLDWAGKLAAEITAVADGVEPVDTVGRELRTEGAIYQQRATVLDALPPDALRHGGYLRAAAATLGAWGAELARLGAEVGPLENAPVGSDDWWAYLDAWAAATKNLEAVAESWLALPAPAVWSNLHERWGDALTKQVELARRSQVVLQQLDRPGGPSEAAIQDYLAIEYDAWFTLIVVESDWLDALVEALGAGRAA